MVWGIRASIWFGITLVAVLFFVWCLLVAIESETMNAGLTWGLIIFGAIALVAGLISIIAQSMAGGVSRARDAFTTTKPAPPRSSGSGSVTSQAGYDHKSASEIPRSSPGRSLT